MSRFLILFLFAQLVCLSSFGQYYDSGQDPNKTRWRQFESDRFQLIYPKGLDSLAAVYFSNLESIAQQESKTLTFKPTQIPVVLHNQTIISNGEVGWAPKRMNLYLVAGQDNYAQPWEQSLTLHEYRHTVQMSKINQGASKALKGIFGEQATAAISGWHVPMWFLEGDAVKFETGTSKAGRGRVPDFSMKIAAQLSDIGLYSYPKAMFGSYKDFVPNRYELGYQLVTGGVNIYGYELWNHSIDKVAQNPIHPNPFSAGIKEITGLTERQLYLDIMQQMKKETELKHKTGLINNYHTIPSQHVGYCNYFSPIQTSKGVLAYKTSMKEIPCFVLIDSLGKAKRILNPGYVFDDTFSATDSMMVWNELKTTRWHNQNFSRIAKYDIVRNELTYLVEGGKVFHSRISSDNKKVLSVEVNEQIKWTITLRDATTGVLLKSFQMDTLQPVQPSWSPDNNKVVFIGISKNGKSLGILDLNSGNIEWIMKDQVLELSHPKYEVNGIWVKGVYNNTSNFYFYSFGKHQWQLLTNVAFGVAEGNFSQGKFLFSNYTSSGLRICSMDSCTSDPISTLEPMRYGTSALHKLTKEENPIEFPQKPIEYKATDYKKITHLLNFHSWAPLAIKVESQEIGWGVSALSQNVLSTSFLTLGYQYHAAEDYQEYYLNYQYKGFYPIIDNKYSFIPFSFTHPDEDTVLRQISGYQQQFSQNWAVPFYFNKTSWSRLIQPIIGYTYTNNYYQPSNYFDLNDIYQHKFAYGLYTYNLQRQSHQDLYSRWGQSLYLQFEQTPFDKNQGFLGAVSGRFYFPGIIPNHSFRVYSGYQLKENGDLPFYGKLLYPRGYSAPKNDEMLSYRFDYSMPLLYPDFNLIELIYLKRVRLNLFYDLTSYKYNNDAFHQDAAGFDLGFDLHALSFIAPINIMFRYAYKISASEHFFDFMFQMDFDSLYGDKAQNVRNQKLEERNQ